MKSKKQLVKSKNSYSKNENSIRLNKFLANAGLGSRREADNFIKMGLVQINGKVIAEILRTRKSLAHSVWSRSYELCRTLKSYKPL